LHNGHTPTMRSHKDHNQKAIGPWALNAQCWTLGGIHETVKSYGVFVDGVRSVVLPLCNLHNGHTPTVTSHKDHNHKANGPCAIKAQLWTLSAHETSKSGGYNGFYVSMFASLEWLCLKG